MATQPSTQTPIPDPGNIHAFIYTWAALGAGDVGQQVTFDYVGSADRTVQMEGTFGGGTCTFEGSNDGVNFHTLNNPLGVALSFTAPGLQQITEACVYMRPHMTGGTSPAVVVTALLRKPLRAT